MHACFARGYNPAQLERIPPPQVFACCTPVQLEHIPQPGDLARCTAIHTHDPRSHRQATSVLDQLRAV